MNIEEKTIWQISAGDGTNKNYVKLCLQKGVVVYGPGKYGAWPDCERPMLADGRKAMQAGIIRRFAEDVKPGDIVVLRTGTRHIYGVGEIVGKYGHSEIFSNVQGWDLQHFRRVRWLWHQDSNPKTFPTYTLKFGSSVQYLISPVVYHWLEALDIPAEAYSKILPEL
jgi:hypothetical protein